MADPLAPVPPLGDWNDDTFPILCPPGFGVERHFTVGRHHSRLSAAWSNAEHVVYSTAICLT